MPIYEYQCSKCEHKMEALQKISDDALADCPACSTANLNKLISAASFRLKGGGWYETDFKTGKKKQLAESETAVPASIESSKTSANGQKNSDSNSSGGKAASAKETAGIVGKDKKQSEAKKSEPKTHPAKSGAS